MKRLMFFISIVAIALFITACGDNNDAADNNTSDNVTDNQNGDMNSDDNRNADAEDANGNAQNDNGNQNTDEDNSGDDSADDMQAKMDKLDYDEIEIEVDYGENNEYEVEIEQDKGQGIEAEIEDEVNGVFLKGEEAFNKLYPKVEALSIDKDTDKETAIKDVLDTFDLDDNYDKFELEITFKDGTKLEYEDK